MISQYLILPEDEARRRLDELGALALRINDTKDMVFHDPNAWFFPPKNIKTWTRSKPEEDCVYGYWGVAPIMIVGSRPSTHVNFEGEQAKTYYRLLAQYGLRKAHLTDWFKTDLSGRVDEKVQAHIFAEELRIVRPFFVLTFKESDRSVRDYLERDQCVCFPRPMPHYSLLPGSGVKSDIRQDSRGRRASILAKI
jgi:hypothetical protein